MNQYDKLGKLLKEAIESGDFQEKIEKKETDNSKKKAELQKATFNDSAEKFFEHQNSMGRKWKQSEFPFLAILGLNPENATESDLKSAYRTLLKKYHPDNVPPYPEMQKTAAKKTQQIVEAYRKLMQAK